MLVPSQAITGGKHVVDATPQQFYSHLTLARFRYYLKVGAAPCAYLCAASCAYPRGQRTVLPRPRARN